MDFLMTPKLPQDCPEIEIILSGCSSAPGIVMTTEQQLLGLQRENVGGEMRLAKRGWQNVESGKLLVAKKVVVS